MPKMQRENYASAGNPLFFCYVSQMRITDAERIIIDCQLNVFIAARYQISSRQEAVKKWHRKWTFSSWVEYLLIHNWLKQVTAGDHTCSIFQIHRQHRISIRLFNLFQNSNNKRRVTCLPNYEYRCKHSGHAGAGNEPVTAMQLNVTQNIVLLDESIEKKKI